MIYVDVAFSVQGDRIPVDHGYHLLSAVSGHVPQLHGDGEVAIHAISGRLLGDRTMALMPYSKLKIRVAADRVIDVLPLAGKNIDLNGHRIQIGIPNALALPPVASLYSRLVVIKGFMEPDPFLGAVRRQLDELGIKGTTSLVSTVDKSEANESRNGGTRSPFLRRTLCIRDKNIVGFAVNVDGLSTDESLLLQNKGVGGRRRFGCGIFVPAKGHDE